MAGVRASRFAFLALPFLLAGCAGFYDEIFLNADGSGSYRLTLFVGKGAAGEDLEAVRSTVRKLAEHAASSAGFTLSSVDVKRDGSLLVITVMAAFRSLSVFASPALSVSPDGGQWSFVVPREAGFRDGRFAARVLRGSAPPPTHAVRATLRGHQARFSVHLPGEIVEANGEHLHGTANWGFPLEQLCDAPVEMVAVARLPFPVLRVALGAALLAALALLGIAAFRWARKRGAKPPVAFSP